MKKQLQVVLAALLLATGSLYAGKGKIRVAADQEGAYIYVDGKKKAMTGEGFTSILLEEGEHNIKVAKDIDENYEYVQSKKVFVGEDTSTKLSFKLKRTITAQGKAMQAQKDAAKLVRWEKRGDVVVDTKLGLIWQDNSVAKNTKKSWKDAKRYCANLTYGKKPMRLPTYDELLSIVDYDRYDPAIMPSFKNVNTSDPYWSSSVYVANEKYAWIVSFENGSTNGGNKTYEYYVLCVRGRQ
ncbi:hypothetical protein MNB_SV-4-162 [hydrothermal vent metagenome]|uniref:Uncharacterized protein n=1 Tax=hydrothermal vent metagenome TaxID=652676 RepID=A0A1W1EB15_9ZZZZ